MKPKRNSGQILIIAAFIMASLLLSAQLYVLEVGKTQDATVADSANDFVINIKQGSQHVMIGSLANISNGGSNSSLDLNLQKWSTLVGKQYLFGKSILNYDLRQAPPYSSGIWKSWGSIGIGVSSAYANFTYKLSDREVTVNQSYFINITTTLEIESTYRIVSGDTKQVNVTINLLNEAEPALTSQVTISYLQMGSWYTPNDTNKYTLLDYGNGTYTASFTASISSSTVEISAHGLDQRGIYVQANATSTQI